MFTTPHLDSHSTTDPKPEILSAVLTGNRIPLDGRNVSGIMHVPVCRKDDIFKQRRLYHSGVGGGITFRRVYPARAYSTVVVLVPNYRMVEIVGPASTMGSIELYLVKETNSGGPARRAYT